MQGITDLPKQGDNPGKFDIQWHVFEVEGKWNKTAGYMAKGTLELSLLKSGLWPMQSRLLLSILIHFPLWDGLLSVPKINRRVVSFLGTIQSRIP